MTIEEKEIHITIRKLIDALTLHNFRDQLRWYKVLYKIGKPAIPQIASTIKTYRQFKNDLHAKFMCISLLTRLIHDIDEVAAKELIYELIVDGCESKISNHLKSISEFTLENFKRYQIDDIIIFEERKLAAKYSIEKQLHKWFENLPKEDVKDIDRIYIIARADQDYNGNYMPILSFINIVWYAPFSRYNPLFWVLILLNEHTFYHEIGHHACGHTVFGRELDQEKEANKYAAKNMIKNHIVLGVIISFIATLINLKGKKSAK